MYMCSTLKLCIHIEKNEKTKKLNINTRKKKMIERKKKKTPHTSQTLKAPAYSQPIPPIHTSVDRTGTPSINFFFSQWTRRRTNHIIFHFNFVYSLMLFGADEFERRCGWYPKYNSRVLRFQVRLLSFLWF